MPELQEPSNGRASGERDACAALLGRLRDAPDDSAAWSEFIARYGRTIYGWCRSWGLQQADAEDVTQEVFLRLAVRLRNFCYDPQRSFRAWLKTVALHEWQHYRIKQRKAGQAGGGDSGNQALESIEARQDLLRRLEDEFDQELLHQVASRVRVRVDPKTWDAFQLQAVQGCCGAEVSQQLGMAVGTAHVARSRVQQMLRREVARLEQQ